MSRTTTFSDLFRDNPMIMEATRIARQFLRAGASLENRAAGVRLNLALASILVCLYFWFLFAIFHIHEDVSEFLLLSETLVVTLVIAFTLYGAIATEREKLTYDALIMTRLTPAQIVWGKLIWRLGMAAAMMALFVPLLIVSRLVGLSYDITHYAAAPSRFGVPTHLTWPLLFWSQVLIFSWAAGLGAFSLWVSARCKKGIVALLTIVGASLAFLALMPALFFLFNVPGTFLQMVHPQHDMAGVYPSVAQTADMPQANLPALSLLLLYVVNPYVSVAMLSDFPSSDTAMNALRVAWYTDGLFAVNVGLYLGLGALFVRNAIATLRGLEAPVADNRKRGR